ncbi:Sec1-like protein [Cryphonectria parasitica EP155]|uniref:Sec1-like protein n=1 Tax=Cryphonectria parasitica (strain ATCC 38755 / EP155) TaxID=660469 RepID=A0A9P5CRD4_CRYP1|nr:Sec1-like protein [Cryphonectria parasitica EP155]KAF3767417.1 Sec1-like protein [Cryphonectria parasitica EP155]
MGVSAFQIQEDIIISKIKEVTNGEWMILVTDTESKRLLDNTVKEDDILNINIANIERLEEKRDANPGMSAIYLLSPQQHIVETLVADLEKQRYQRAHLLWINTLSRRLRDRIASSRASRSIAGEHELNIDFFPRESHLITFRDPYSFPTLYNPKCNDLVKEHMETLARKITDVCVSLGEYPKIRYYRPNAALHDAQVLCYHFANLLQQELDNYARRHQEYPPPSSRPQSVLFITDRSMDLMAPLLHEFTYQAMAHDLLPIKEGEKVTYRIKINDGEEEQDMELQEKDETWVENRHRHMKDTIDTLMSKFQKFVAENPGATDDGNPANLNMIKDMLANMPKYQQLKDAYTLHLAMAEDCMNAFQARKLPEIQSVEQSLATGLDEDLRKAKNLLPTIVRLLDDESVLPIDRERLIIAWLIYRYGVVEEDIKRLLAHAQLYGGEPKSEKLDIIHNLQLLGARILAPLKDERKAPEPLFPVDTKQELNEEYGLVRYHPNVKHMLEYFCEGRLQHDVFPYTKQEDQEAMEVGQVQSSLRAAKPSWASRTGAGATRRQDNRQRLIVFMAGGATFSESRACYEVAEKHNREVFLITSHMVSPKLFLRQVQDLDLDRNRLDLPMLRKPGLPKWVTEPERPTPPPVMYSQGAPAPPPKGGPGGGLPPGPRGGLPGRPGPMMAPTQQMSAMSIASAPPRPSPVPPPANGGASSASYHSPTASSDSNKLEKEKKKKRNIFGIKK